MANISDYGRTSIVPLVKGGWEILVATNSVSCLETHQCPNNIPPERSLHNEAL